MERGGSGLRVGTIISNGSGGAILKRFAGLFPFLRCDGLPMGDAHSEVVVSPECGWGDFTAHVAVDAGAVHIEGARGIAGILFIWICHMFLVLRAGSISGAVMKRWRARTIAGNSLGRLQ